MITIERFNCYEQAKKKAAFLRQPFFNRIIYDYTSAVFTVLMILAATL